MVYKFRIISNESKDFVRDLEILSDQSFYDFHKALVENFHYDKSQIASFFLSNDNWEKEKEFTLFDMSEGENNNTITMDSTRLSDHIETPKQRLLYLHDFFNDRALFIELVGVLPQEDSVKYPRFTRKCGCPPPQLLMDNLNLDDLDFEE